MKPSYKDISQTHGSKRTPAMIIFNKDESTDKITMYSIKPIVYIVSSFKSETQGIIGSSAISKQFWQKNFKMFKKMKEWIRQSLIDLKHREMET